MTTTTSRIANALYSSGCLRFGSFRIKSGAFSPYYLDLAHLLSSPKHLRTVTDIVASEVKRIAATTKIDKLASIELKGALLLAGLSIKTGLPSIVVRKEQKTYGATGRTAGAEVERGDCVLFFDDVVSHGLSKLEGIRPLEEMGVKIERILVVVDREQGGRQHLEQAGYRVQSLSSISELVDSLLRQKHVTREQAISILNYTRKAL